MARFLNATALYTLRDGDHRLRRLEEFCKTHPKVQSHLYKSGFDNQVENLIAAIEFKAQPWGEIDEVVQSFRDQFLNNEFFVDRVRLIVPLLQLGYFEAEGQRHRYFLGSDTIYVPSQEKQKEALREFCRNHGLMLALDAKPRKKQVGYDVWHISQKYEHPPNGGIKAQTTFRSYLADLYATTKIAVKLNVEIQSVVQDNEEEEDLRWVAPPLLGGALDSEVPF